MFVQLRVDSLASTQGLLANDLQASFNPIFFYYVENAASLNRPERQRVEPQLLALDVR